jgi:hypothetical protein
MLIKLNIRDNKFIILIYLNLFINNTLILQAGFGLISQFNFFHLLGNNLNLRFMMRLTIT